MRRISAFDLDYTLVSSNSSLLFYRYLVSKGACCAISFLKTILYSFQHRFLHLSLTALHEKIFNRFLKGTSYFFFQEEILQFLKHDFYRFLYYPSFERLRWAQHQGHHTVILSNAPSFIVGPIADYLEVNQWHASHYSIDKEGHFKAIESLLSGEEKAARLAQLVQELGVSSEDVTAYSDSDLDLPFLLSAHTPIAVNPNRRLLAISKKNFWEII